LFARALGLEAEEVEQIKQKQRRKQVSAAAELKRQEEEKAAKAAAANQRTEQGLLLGLQQVASDAAAFLQHLKRLETQTDAAAIIQGMLTHHTQRACGRAARGVSGAVEPRMQR
jgi:hypothetical protein